MVGSELETVQAAVRAAGGLRRDADAAIASQAFPYLTDVLGGFALHLAPSGPGGIRVARVALHADGADATLLDTVLAGTTMPDAARVDAASARDWDGIAAFLLRAGVVLEARVNGRKAALRLAGGRLEIVSGKAGPAAASIAFVDPARSLLVQAELASGERLCGLDWVLVQHALAGRGVLLHPKPA